MLSGPGPVENLQIVEVPTPEPPPGWVRIRVKAFGLNRSELHTRLGYAEGVVFPRVPGIEATGVVDDPNGSDLTAGQQVATMMGGMGRDVRRRLRAVHRRPPRQVIPFVSELPWAASAPCRRRCRPRTARSPPAWTCGPGRRC